MTDKTVRYWDGDNGPYEVEVNANVAEEFAREHGGEIVTEDAPEDTEPEVTEEAPSVIGVGDIPTSTPSEPRVIGVDDIPNGDRDGYSVN